MSQVTFSEVMFDPATNEYYDEFIEITNTGGSPVLLKNTALDEPAHLIINGSENQLYSPDDNYLLNPGQKAVVLDNGYLVEGKSTVYDDMIPDSVVLLTIEGASFGSNGLTNSAPNQLLLIDPVVGDTLTQYTTTPDQEEGYSDEKIILTEPNNEDNWSNSLELKGTPGLPNSVTPRDFDAGIISAQFVAPGQPFPGDTLFARIEVANKGLKSISAAELVCGLDQNQDSVLQSEEISLQTEIDLNQGDSLSQELMLVNNNSYRAQAIAQIDYPDDQNQSDNSKIFTINISYPDTCVVINEIMYDPDQGSDWIELYNRANYPINLQNWRIFDAVGYDDFPDRDYNLLPNDYVVLVEDSSFLNFWPESINIFSMDGALPSFNNSGDAVIIKDHTGITIDSLEYSASWGGGDGFSLERRNPFAAGDQSSNWGSSEASQGASPGQQNSIMVQDYDLKVVYDSLRVFPDHISAGDSVFTEFVIKNTGLLSIDSLKVELRYNQIPDSLSLQEPIVTKKYSDTLSSGGTIKDTLAWKLKTGGSGYLQISIFAPEDQNNQNDQVIRQVIAGYPPKSVLINEIMYNPVSGSPEWFEIRNVSDTTVNMSDWLFKDSQNSLNYITRQIAFLDSAEYLVISADESFLDEYPDFSGKLMIASTFPTLNNSQDSLALIGPDGNYIDSLLYTSEWGMDKGRSIERHSPEKYSNSADNWSLSRGDEGATPGYMNSVAMRRYDLTIDSVWIDNSPVLDQDTARVKVRVYNTGIDNISNYNVLINVYQTDSLSNCFYQNEIMQNITLESESSTVAEFQIPDVPGGVHYYTATVIHDLDQSLDNNSYSGQLAIGYQQASVVINEIMYSPASGEAEWFELFNTTNRPVNLQNWSFSDATKSWSKITDSIYTLEPGDYAVLASNSELFQTYPDFDGQVILSAEFPSLNNTSDNIFIRDAVDHRLDHIIYKSDWGGGESLSLERKNPYVEALNESNWGSSRDSLGATPGRDNSILKFDYDLALDEEGFKFSQKNVESGQLLNFQVKAINKGINLSSTYDIILYKDENRDSLPCEEEKVWELRNIPSLQPDSSRIVEGKIFSGEPGKENYIVILKAEKDYNPHNNRLDTDLNVSYPARSLVLNEFITNPGDQQVEFVELYNRSSQNINIVDWTFQNSWFGWKIEKDVFIEPGEYLIMTGDSAFYDYFGSVDMNILVSPDFPRLTNVSDTISFIDLAGKTIDSLFYDENWGMERGFSMEKYLPEYNSADPNSWKKSVADKGATPGHFNSISPLEYDLGIDSLIYTESGDTNDTFPTTFTFVNQGRKQVEDAKILITDSLDNVIREADIPAIQPGQSKQLDLDLGPFKRGYTHCEASIVWQPDLNKKNNYRRFDIYVSYLPGELVISEFMAIPFTTYEEGTPIAEFVEIYNFTSSPVDLTGWSITDANTADRHQLNKKW
ncbi:MAG TPA: lamin tail domain-containing protein, partial [bacterium]|nr:lamin tail domain-containing protein [bacterium]